MEISRETDRHRVARIVASYAKHNKVAVDDLPDVSLRCIILERRREGSPPSERKYYTSQGEAAVVAGAFLFPRSDRAALLRPGRLCGVEFPVALFDAASPFVSGKDHADMVWASTLACSSDFLLCFAGC